MEQIIFRHMDTVRGITEKAINSIPEQDADIVPNGFNNNIRWNFGHIAFVQENLVYGVLGKKMGLPEEYEELFSPGTKPADWQQTPPSLREISIVLSEQKRRIRETLKGGLEEKLLTPYTNRMGITFHTVGETFLFSFYHEALHMETIKRIIK
ncbi:DinB family protein [Oceanobacillus saliphilus]|uniref:DinB family protein n=1 Tax=Oceanobacillus saliphilus TaxID=2925834 RepID=UPI00201E6715|nr:DinB family protein [Oceanobacillus saliphilus]